MYDNTDVTIQSVAWHNFKATFGLCKQNRPQRTQKLEKTLKENKYKIILLNQIKLLVEKIGKK